MAKKSKGIDVSFEEFNDMISGFSEFGSLIDDSEYANVPDWISTGNYTLNALISGDIFRGVPAGKITVFSGEEATGKTFLSLNVAKQAQLKDYMVFWIDTESALTKELTDRFDINPKRFRYDVFGVVSEVITFVKKTTNHFLQLKKEGKNPPKIIFVLDSLGNLSTDKETSDSLDGNLKKDMTRAQEIKRMFRVLTTEVAKIQAPFVIINHVYEMVGSFIPMKTQAGGSGVKYNSSVTVNLSKAKLKETSGKQVGVTVTCKLDKARFTIPSEPKKIQIHFLKGMNPFIGLESFITPEVAEKIGFGPGKLSPATSKYTHDSKEFPSYWVNFETNKNVKKQMIYNTEYFTQEKLEIINEEAKKQLTYGLDDLNVSELVEEDNNEIENSINETE